MVPEAMVAEVVERESQTSSEEVQSPATGWAPPIVVYHVACMGNWTEVIREQFLLLRESGLAPALAAINDTVRLTHVGYHLDAVLAEAARHDVPVTVVRTDSNTDHYETFAMMEIERLAKVERVTRPILYLHTKGVSSPGDPAKAAWRRAMGFHVVVKWRENLVHLKDRDAVGMNWWNHGEQHFSGTFWLAKADWIRRLPDFVQYHHAKDRVRFSCELWIGAAQWCNAYSHGDMNAVVWTGNYDFARLLPAETPQPHSITWITAATPGYVDDLTRLQSSLRLLGPGHTMMVQILDLNSPWRHVVKLQTMRRLLPSVRTTHVFWIDADCEFLTTLRPGDFIDDTRPLSAVRHFAYSDPREVIPERLRNRLPANPAACYWQACLWGGTVGAVADVAARLRWLDDDPHGYDEHGLNIELCGRSQDVHTLPCRYAAPTSFAAMPLYQETYAARAGGGARVLHHNREIHR